VFKNIFFSNFKNGFKRYLEFLGVLMAKVFLATLGKGRGTWGHVARIIQEGEWDSVFLVSNDFGKENFAPSQECDWLMINTRSGFDAIKDQIKEVLPEGELSVSIVSGIGKEHMALLSALREAGRDFKIVVLTGDGMKFY